MIFKPAKIVQGNIVVIGHKVHKLNPKKLWRWGKYVVYIIREIDREPVSNEDMDEIRAAGQDTDEDVPLIKAVLGARQKPTIGDKKGLIVAIIIIVIIGAVLFAIFGGGGTP